MPDFRRAALSFIGAVIAFLCMPIAVYADVSQSPTNFYNISDEQTVSISFANSTDQTVTEVNAYVDQTYLKMGGGSAHMDTCSSAQRADDGNWKFSGCSIAAGSSAGGSFPVVAIGGEFTGALGMNYTYGGSSNEVSVTISGTPSTDAGTSSTTGTTTTTNTTTTITKIVVPTPTPTPLPDRTPPVATITTDLTKPVTVAPKVEGKATDPSGVAAKIEYSVDDGRNWAPVDEVKSPGAASTTFSFTPIGLLDDNYTIRIRSADTKGNTGVTKASWAMVVDRLPPLLGGTILTLGAQVMEPTQQGSVVTLSGLSEEITFSAVGGPTQIDLRAGDTPIPVKKNADTGLWTGTVTLDTPGTYVVKAHAVDGAGNTSDRTLGTMLVLPNGVVTGGAQPVQGASVTVYYLDDPTKQFIAWDGNSYGQENPQKTSTQGAYRLYLPQGMYYLRISAGGFQTQVSSIFSLSQGTPITASFSLLPARSIRIGPWTIPLPDFRQTTVDMTIAPSPAGTTPPKQAIVGSELPYFSFALDGATVTSTGLHGKPTILTFFNTWSPQASSQLAILDSLSKQKEINVVGIVLQESVSSVTIFRKRGGYTVPIVADPDGSLIPAIDLHTVPTHVFLNRKGVVGAVVSGILTRDALLDQLTKQ